MNEKEYALKIKKELEQVNNDFQNEKEYICCYMDKKINKLINEEHLNIDDLINECSKLNINVNYANKMKINKRHWLNEWNKEPRLVFYF